MTPFKEYIFIEKPINSSTPWEKRDADEIFDLGLY